MAHHSHIEWTEATWNPVTGCTKISAGCKNCYAERLALRLRAMGNHRYRNGFRVTLHKDVLDLPRTWKTPRRCELNERLVSSRRPALVYSPGLQDHGGMSTAYLSGADETKRSGAETQRETFLAAECLDGCERGNARVFHRIDDLRIVPAAVRFLSCEPLIGSLKGIDLNGLHWVIVGGESGPHSRPMNIQWVREIFRACRKQKVPFFFKQWGGVRKDLTGRLLGGRIYDEMPNRIAA
jgi:protein gp37